LRGHTGSIGTLDYFGSQDRYFLSSSPLDPLVNVWDRLHDSQLPIAGNSILLYYIITLLI
jgi:hypothetical protein